ncbi:methylated-DNA--[protein]-cysteine S-methyltransferase [Dactylosporangium sp. AC04546]|uniref:methylated-DNA--[protein]-cysteine S-methyltransferase n=1 Tax=Dactylosporangium sp. AC04546 TaxID=2862460 RepID=UPI001EDE4FE5|nr:methylated-DNA--[protein]-cysteine S-methyltransferase [Dactylosporangium sp. AC04546]WVK84805.1 methylated-DNA--[protein]-cysteine S-methyltransferase [Dactylosporangium sp. AC04546]
MNLSYATTDTPAGPFTTVVDADGVVVASGWTTDVPSLVRLARLDSVAREKDEVGDASKAVHAYLDGDLTAIDAVPVRQHSGEFLMHAWEVLRRVPAGAPVTYSEFAVRAGRPPAIRAAAQACGRNAAALFVPCHRVLRLDGTLGGFRWGLPVKRWLLDFEAAH